MLLILLLINHQNQTNHFPQIESKYKLSLIEFENNICFHFDHPKTEIHFTSLQTIRTCDKKFLEEIFGENERLLNCVQIREIDNWKKINQKKGGKLANNSVFCYVIKSMEENNLFFIDERRKKGFDAFWRVRNQM
jgi:hypothetical protein